MSAEAASRGWTKGRLKKKAYLGRVVPLPPEGAWITQGALARLTRRSHTAVRRWVGRREATRAAGEGPNGKGARYLVDEVLVDALEEWGYVVTIN